MAGQLTVIVLFCLCRAIYVGNRPVTPMNNNSISTLMHFLHLSAGRGKDKQNCILFFVFPFYFYLGHYMLQSQVEICDVFHASYRMAEKQKRVEMDG